jgi:hypothetical protein
MGMYVLFVDFSLEILAIGVRQTGNYRRKYRD